MKIQTQNDKRITLVFDARGNGGGYDLPYDYRRPSEPNYRLYCDFGRSK